MELYSLSFVVADSVGARHLFYKDPSLFKSQQVVDRYVESLAFTLGVQRADLNVVSGVALGIPFLRLVADALG